MSRFQTILHPTDFSPGSAAAFRYACDLARDYDGRVVILFAMGPAIPIAAEGVILSENPEELREIARRELAAIKPDDPTVRVERLFREGPAAEVILETARSSGADLIVMGTHGRTGFRRLVLGSVAEQVLRHAPCPVLTVKPDQNGSSNSMDRPTARADAV